MRMILFCFASNFLAGPISIRRMRFRIQLLAAFCFLAAGAPDFCAAVAKTPHVEAEIVSRYAAVKPGQPVEAALRLKIIEHWHTYWRNPGDSGLPTKLTWSLPAGLTAGPIEWPYPKKLPLGPLMNFGYEGEALHLVTLQTPAGLRADRSVTLRAKAEWLVCSDVCIPESADLAITLPVVDSTPLPDPRWAKAFTDARAALPGTLTGWTKRVTIENDQANLAVTPPSGEDFAPAQFTFYPLREDVIANAGKQTFSATADGMRLAVPLAEPVNSGLTTLDGVLVNNQGWGKSHSGRAVAVSVPVSYVSAASALSGAGKKMDPKFGTGNADAPGLAIALLFAFIGGLILNLMPCVFPVLGIKVLGFVQHAQGEQKRLRQQGLAFLCGVIVSFWVLAGLLIALRAAGESVGWGFQLQSPVFVTLLAMLFLLMALNLSGVFEFGLRLQSAAGNLHGQGKRKSLTDAFLSGVLATVIATPCTAPFMGAAMGFTLSQPAQISFLVFTSVALGMATPVLVLSLFPRWLRHLPKPGAWMDAFKQFMAFPLFATVAWLAWVLGSQLGNDGVGMFLFGTVVVALGAWLYGESFPHGLGVVVAGIVAVVAFGVGAVGLCTSPLVAGVHASDAIQLLAGRGRLARHRASRHARN